MPLQKDKNGRGRRISRSKLILFSVYLVAAAAGAYYLVTPSEMPSDSVRAPASIEIPIFKDADPHADLKKLGRDAFIQTGIPARRARKVRFSSQAFRSVNTPSGGVLKMALFDDVVLSIRFMGASPQLNQRGEFVGLIEGDSESRVQLWSTQNNLTGEIVTTGRTFKFTSAGGGLHWIIEVETVK